ncbi:MAG: tRNA threonylcarbamoyladenosine biosynthesis protein [Bacteroidetes bacterium]|nr:MAG: tRNA threonylcarbamoyladenosine biosynthesis protein [Bacteroidota bacterium]
MKSFDEEVLMAAEALRKGKVIVYPTDTIWGLGCDATNSKAVERLFKIKRKKEQNNLIALIDSVSRLEDYLKVVPPIALDLIAFAANPISIVYPGAKNLAKNVMGSDGSVCIRVTSDPFCVALVKRFGKAIASTSANISGESTPLFFAQISEAILKNADHVVGFYQDEVKAPKASSIIKLQSDGQFTIIRS